LAAKLKNALIGSVVLMSLSSVGFVEGENAIQPAGVADGGWGLFCLFPAAGFAIALIILLLFYKLRTRDVKVMSRYNNGEITREEAEALLGEKYGPAGDA
jgi:Na+/melibiose symporter-like transporter